jgi:hypothetical protein
VLPGLVADMDAMSPYRKSNEGKAPDVQSLENLIHDFESHYYNLTLVRSGFGLYPTARFKEPLHLEDEVTRKEAETLLKRFTEAFRIFARQYRWPNTVEVVALGGLIRIPGTFNHKASSPIPVRLEDRL